MRISGAVAFGFVISPPRKYASHLRGTTVMSKRTREKKSAKPQQPAKPDQIPVGRKFAQPYAKARLLFDHAHSYREWNIVGQYDVPGFFYLESQFRLNPGEQPAIYTAFELCLHECQFERVQV
jgi:hypothetical protein